MYYRRIKYRSYMLPFICMALLLFCNAVYTQNRSEDKIILRISHGTVIQINNSNSFYLSDTLLRLPSSLIPKSIFDRDKNLVFFDSLKAKASKNLVTRKLYDLVIVASNKSNAKQIAGRSDAGYINYSGKKIRKIEIRRLKVFGTNINNPGSANPDKTDNLLNKTHLNTSENIIRNNLLFSEGDIISPLMLSDNERILRQLPYIDDARIVVEPVSADEADIVIFTKDIYSLGASVSSSGLKKGTASVFEKNMFGIGHELGIEIPFDARLKDSPGFGVHYLIDNIGKSFVNLNLYYLNGLGKRTYGFNIDRKLISSTTKYAGGIAVKQMYTSEDLDTLPVPEPLKYNLQDYWLSRSFLINKDKVSRIIIGARYKNNNVFDRPFILPDSYYNLQNYRIFLASAAISIQKYYKTNLIYGYGRTEDIPYGGLFRFTVGREYNEFNQYRKRTYLATEIAIGKSNKSLGYFYTSAGLATFIDGTQSRQGLLSLSLKYFSNLITFRKYKVRNFLNIDYTRGFDRNTDEFLAIKKFNGFSGFRNDSISGTQRLSLSIESVLFSPDNLYGFRFAFFGFADLAFLFETNEIIKNGNAVSGIGIGVRIRNDNLVFNTFQIRVGYFPNPPLFSKINNLSISGEQLLRPNNFDSGPPAIIPFR
jgi:hypothetical protein